MHAEPCRAGRALLCLQQHAPDTLAPDTLPATTNLPTNRPTNQPNTQPQVYPERKAPLARALHLLRGQDDDADAAPAPAAAPAAWAAAVAAAALGTQLTSAEWAILQQQMAALQGGAAVGPQCIALDAERLAASL